MKIPLKSADFTSKEAYVRAVLIKARELALDEWDKDHARINHKLARELGSLTKQELARRLIRILHRPARRRAIITDAMRRQAADMRKGGTSVRDIASELGMSIPSVYNIIGK